MNSSQISSARVFGGLWRCALHCVGCGAVCAVALMLVVRLLA